MMENITMALTTNTCTAYIPAITRSNGEEID